MITHRLAQLMSDGRERTTADVATALNIKSYAAIAVLRKFQVMGLLKSDRAVGVLVWRKA